jgi:hypothetical protein
MNNCDWACTLVALFIQACAYGGSPNDAVGWTAFFCFYSSSDVILVRGMWSK